MPDPRANRAVKNLSKESKDIIDMLSTRGTKGPKIISESMKSNATKQNDQDNGTMLDENNIL